MSKKITITSEKTTHNGQETILDTLIPSDCCLKDISFTKLEQHFLGMSLFVDGKEVANGFFGEVLEKAVPYADRKVISSNIFFNQVVIRV